MTKRKNQNFLEKLDQSLQYLFNDFAFHSHPPKNEFQF